jgi:hypothetical protein
MHFLSFAVKGRFIQVSFNSVYFSERDLQKKVTLHPEARQGAISSGCHSSSCFNAMVTFTPLTLEVCAFEVQTDASDQGFGVWFRGHLHSRRWDSFDALNHIYARLSVLFW